MTLVGPGSQQLSFLRDRVEKFLEACSTHFTHDCWSPPVGEFSICLSAGSRRRRVILKQNICSSPVPLQSSSSNCYTQAYVGLIVPLVQIRSLLLSDGSRPHNTNTLYICTKAQMVLNLARNRTVAMTHQ